MAFVLDHRIESASAHIARLELSDLRLQNDSRFIWCILIPRRAGVVELDDLDPQEAQTLTQEVRRTSMAVRRLMQAQGRPADKLNVAALGNVVSQLHVHVVGRRRDDGCWPEPVWGRGAARPYAEAELASQLERARSALEEASR